MRKLIIRDHRGHAELDLDTAEAIQELEKCMNAGMLAVATDTSGNATQLTGPTDALIAEASEIRAMWPLRGGRGR